MLTSARPCKRVTHTQQERPKNSISGKCMLRSGKPDACAYYARFSKISRFLVQWGSAWHGARTLHALCDYFDYLHAPLSMGKVLCCSGGSAFSGAWTIPRG